MSEKNQGPMQQGIPVPVTPISPGDLSVVAEIMSGYLAFVRLAFRVSVQRSTYVRYVESLRERLCGRHGENTPIQLTLEDIETIEAAMSTFEVITAQMAPHTKERVATIAACACLRERIARMRGGSGSRRYLN